MKELLQRFLQYVSIDTQSDENTDTQPSTNKQFNLLKLLSKELSEFGVENTLDNFGYLYANIPANTQKDVPAIGFISHVDTSPEVSGKNIKTNIIHNYDGEDILLNATKKIYLRTADYPEIKNYIHQTIITTDGTTLLGADDKAGVAAIMQAVEHIVKHPTFEHGDIKIAFTPDEEIGRGTEHFDLKKFGAKYAYTVDGGEVGEIEYECFNAASAKISIIGNNIHPGYAKDKMINASQIAMEIHSQLPQNERPENTEDRQGFFHLTNITACVEKAEIHYIIRDHDKILFENRKTLLNNIIDRINQKYGKIVTLEISDNYCNMLEFIKPHFEVVEIAIEAIKEIGIEPKIRAIRGGTDGAELSRKGLPCPNIFAGGHNFHSKYEYVALESIEKTKQVIINILQKYLKLYKK